MNEAKHLLLEMIDSAYDGRGWHGTTLRGSLRGLSPEKALWRPSAGRHNIWELAVHAAYWKYIVRRRLLREKRGSFPLKGSNWFEAPLELSAADIRQVVSLLNEQHRAMRDAIVQIDPLPQSGKLRPMLYGIAAHDLYHTGQIQLIRRLGE